MKIVKETKLDFTLDDVKKDYEELLEMDSEAIYDREHEHFHCECICEVIKRAEEAWTFIHNLQNMDYVKDIEWEMFERDIIVSWSRLITFDEFLEYKIADIVMCNNSNSKSIIEEVERLKNELLEKEVDDIFDELGGEKVDSVECAIYKFKL